MIKHHLYAECLCTGRPRHNSSKVTHLLLIDDAKRGLADIAAGRTFEADTALAQLQQRRKTAAKLPTKKRG